MLKEKSGITLMELLIAVSLLGVVLLGVSAVSLFSQIQVRNADREGRNQSEAAYILEHMTKQVSRAIGNEQVNGSLTVAWVGVGPGGTRLTAYVDENMNGQVDAWPTDRWIGYRYNSGNYQVTYCRDCDSRVCNNCRPGSNWETLGNNIANFTPSLNQNPLSGALQDNIVGMQVTACWDPDGNPFACGTPDNPSVTMRTNIIMPSVSSN